PSRPGEAHIYLPDVDAAFARAVERGAKPISVPTDRPWGDRWGALRDRFGNVWHIATPGNWALGAAEMPRSVQPYLHLRDAHKMIAFLEKAFDAKSWGPHLSPEGKVLHATLEIAGSTLEIAEAYGEFQPQPFLLHVYVPDPDRLYEQALNEG